MGAILDRRVEIGKLGTFEVVEVHNKSYEEKIFMKWDCTLLGVEIIAEMGIDDIDVVVKKDDFDYIKLSKQQINLIKKAMLEFDHRFQYFGLHTIFIYVYNNYLYEEEWF